MGSVWPAEVQYNFYSTSTWFLKYISTSNMNGNNVSTNGSETFHCNSSSHCCWELVRRDLLLVLRIHTYIRQYYVCIMHQIFKNFIHVLTGLKNWDELQYGTDSVCVYSIRTAHAEKQTQVNARHPLGLLPQLAWFYSFYATETFIMHSLEPARFLNAPDLAGRKVNVLYAPLWVFTPRRGCLDPETTTLVSFS